MAAHSEEPEQSQKREKEAENILEPHKDDEKRRENEEEVDPELFSCLLQPIAADSDLDYIGIRRLLLRRKAESGAHRRIEWRCNGKGYVAYRNFIARPRNWESLLLQSHSPNQRFIYWLMHQWTMDWIFRSTLSSARGG